MQVLAIVARTMQTNKGRVILREVSPKEVDNYHNCMGTKTGMAFAERLDGATICCVCGRRLVITQGCSN